MDTIIKIAAICGSTRKSSSNLTLLRIIETMVENNATLDIIHNLEEIPHFNPDLDQENPPAQVTAFRKRLKTADAILICTPEYAMGVPGTLKNALDWTVSSMEFSKKPVGLITASSVGEKGHAALMETLKVIESEIPETCQLIIPFVKSKIKEEKITDNATLLQVQSVMDSLFSLVQRTE